MEGLKDLAADENNVSELCVANKSVPNVVSEIFISITISLFILLKIVELILKQINQHNNYKQQNEKINVMCKEYNSGAAQNSPNNSDEELTKKIYKVVQVLRTTP